MDKISTVYYDGEVFRPEGPVDLEPNARYIISIKAVPESSSPEEQLENAETAWDVLKRLAGTIDGPVDRKPDEPVEAEKLSTLFRRMAGTVEAPPDWSAEHDHYIHGTPKRSEGNPS